MEVGEPGPKDQVLKLYPDAYCGYFIRHKWIIFEDQNQKLIAHSYNSEEQAWEWALTVINNRILVKLAS